MFNNSTINTNIYYQSGAQNVLFNTVRGLGQLFYFHNVSATSFKDVEEVPNFYRNAWPCFLIFILLENIILYYQKKPIMRLNDGITSLSHGLIQECGRLVFRGGESVAYIYIYNNYRITDLSWDSPWTWYLALFAVDFCYYWVHRASHEIHIFWAQHQVHHSSEEFNVAVGLRQSVLQGWCSFIFYLPMALIIPPAHFVAHQQFNLIYQVWIHTKTIQNLGPLEYVFNTPKHHRVHHGCNLYCLDKNYGGVFIIWDRLFNTFASELDKDEIIYGLVYNQPSFNPLFLQFFYNQYLFYKFKSMKGFKNKVSSIIKGPSWMPGSPWTGFKEDKINVKPRAIYDVKISSWANLYISIHFICILIEFQLVSVTCKYETFLATLTFIGFIILSLTTIGMILENHSKAVFFEIFRCILFSVYFYQNTFLLKYKVFSQFLQFLYIGSAVMLSLYKLS